MKKTTKAIIFTFISMMSLSAFCGCKNDLAEVPENYEETASEHLKSDRRITIISDNGDDGRLGAHGTSKHGGHGGNGRGSRGENHGSSKNN